MRNILKTFCITLYILSCGSAFAGQIISPEPGGVDKASIISANNIKPILLDELKKNGISENVIINLAESEKGIKLKEKARQYFVDIDNFSIIKENNRFKAKISFKGSNNFRESVLVSGIYDELVKIPVLKTSLSSKSIISADDITWMDIEKRKLLDSIVTSENDIVGKALKRSMKEMSPIKEKDLEKQTVVSRNQEVSILYKTNFITLRTSGVAVEAGGKGDVIRVRNKESNKIIDAVVQGTSLVVVSQQKTDL